MSNQAKYLFASNFERDADAGAAGSLIALAEGLGQDGHDVDCIWRPEGGYRLPHARLREIWELPEMLRAHMEKQMSHVRYDYVIASQPYAYRAFEALKQRHPDTVFLNRTHGWEVRAIQANRRLHWRREPPLRELLSRASQIFTGEACRRVVRAAHGMIASSTLCGDYIRRHYGLSTDRVAVIPHGFTSSGTGGTKTDRSGRMLYVGQFLPRKGSLVLEQNLPKILQAFPAASVTFVVPPESVAHVQQQFPSAAVHAWMPRERLNQLYQEHQILLYPSLFEGFGKVFLEGMAAGLCVVGFAEGGIADIAKCGRDALFASPGDCTQFCELLSYALQNPVRTRRMGDTAAETARQFTWRRAASITHEFCQKRRAECLAPGLRETRGIPFAVPPKNAIQQLLRNIVGFSPIHR